MNDTRRRMLTEYLGECWHEGGSDYYRTCVTCHRIHSNYELENERRTFTTPADLHALVLRMVGKGEWHNFYSCVWKVLIREVEDESQILAVLITDPARTCELIAEWMEGKHESTK